MDNFVCLTICIVHAQAFLRCFDWRDLLKCSRLFSRKPSFPQTAAKNTVPVAFVSCERVTTTHVFTGMGTAGDGGGMNANITYI